MSKVGEIIAPMKDNFIVAYLACAHAKEDKMVVPKPIADFREKHGIKSLHFAANEEARKKKGATNGSSEGSSSDSKRGKGVKQEDGDNDTGNNVNSSSTNKTSVKVEDTTNSNGSNGVQTNSSPSQTSVVVAREGKFAAMEARKRSIEGNVKKVEIKSTAKKDEKKDKPSTTITVKDSKGRLVKVLDDDEEEMDCEFLNTRQLFLELCQTNNYQYDQMRRAKHSSMMVLFHLHNRDAPKFVQQCAVCAREILSGFRFHCPTCADFDLCQECNVKSERGMIQKHQHELKKMAVATDGKNQQTEEQRKERQRSIQLHMTLLLHAASCNNPKCASQNCHKMKNLLLHGETCKTKHSGGCNVCKRIWTLLQIHARQCKDPKCLVPKCLVFRQRLRQLAMQQRAMDDRRRQQMNTQYRTVQS